MEVGQGPNWGCSAKENKYTYIQGVSKMRRVYIAVLFARAKAER
jgi:hypothetical protein